MVRDVESGGVGVRKRMIGVWKRCFDLGRVESRVIDYVCGRNIQKKTDGVARENSFPSAYMSSFRYVWTQECMHAE